LTSETAPATQVPDAERYTRLRELGWNMEVLGRARVMVVGAGALGNEIIKNLALAGLGNLLIIDPDRIESHNLTRSVLFRGADVGEVKAQIAARTAGEIEPNLDVRWFHKKVQPTFGLGVFRRVDVVLGAVDNLQTRRDLNSAAMRTGRPFIDGGLFFLDGDVRVFAPPFPACFDCTLSDEERADGQRRWSCLGLMDEGSAQGGPVGPTAPTISSMIGGLQAQLALKYLHRDTETLYKNRIPNATRIRFNGFADEYESWSLSRDTECPTHLSAEPIDPADIEETNFSVRTTGSDLLAHVQRRHGPEAYVDLGFDLVHCLTCGNCGRTDSSLQRQGAVPISQTICPDCTPANCKNCGRSIVESAILNPELVFPDRVQCAHCFEANEMVLRAASTVNRIEAGSPLLGRTLAEMSVPMLEVLEVGGSEQPQRAYIELTGDEPGIFGDR
jgi:molybdopterin/thiamine biosynthesis adenylyltransferase